ncbi:MAG: ABC transporter permease [Gammaproteobacteria bacterium]|nr:ABC transporter permease [Gammaproteobacteria bacterium]
MAGPAGAPVKRTAFGQLGIAGSIAAVMVACALLAPLLAPHDPYVGMLADRLLPPSWLDGGDVRYLLGTDILGRDVLSRLLYGARVSLLVAVAAVMLAGIVGSTIGIVAGYFGGWLDSVLMRIVDLVVSLPMILIALLVGVIAGPSLTNIIIIIGFVLWSQFARMARAETLRVRQLAFIDLARSAGLAAPRIMLEHVLPNIAGPLLVLATLQVGTVIIMEASLSFLGVGVPPPAPAWGTLIADGRSYVLSAWWICIFPGLAIITTVMTANLLGDGLADRLDPARKAGGQS